MPPVLRVMLELKGCTNRPFYHVVASHLKRRPDQQPLEQIGSFDPMPNERNEKLVSINFDRLNYWFGQGATPSRGVGMLLGMAGYTMVYPYSYLTAWRRRRAQQPPPASSTSSSGSKEGDAADEAQAAAARN